VKSYTAHLKPGEQPVLVKEGWSWGAFLFGPLWLAAQRAWLPAAALLALMVLLGALPGGWVLVGALAVLAGLMGRDAVRWSLDRRGFECAAVLAARDEDTALGRLLTYRPELAAGLAAILE
jgi:hypothetical protein